MHGKILAGQTKDFSDPNYSYTEYHPNRNEKIHRFNYYSALPNFWEYGGVMCLLAALCVVEKMVDSSKKNLFQLHFLNCAVLIAILLRRYHISHYLNEFLLASLLKIFINDHHVEKYEYTFTQIFILRNVFTQFLYLNQEFQMNETMHQEVQYKFLLFVFIPLFIVTTILLTFYWSYYF